MWSLDPAKGVGCAVHICVISVLVRRENRFLENHLQLLKIFIDFIQSNSHFGSFHTSTKIYTGPTTTGRPSPAEVSCRFRIPATKLTWWTTTELQILAGTAVTRSIRKKKYTTKMAGDGENPILKIYTTPRIRNDCPKRLVSTKYNG